MMALGPYLFLCFMVLAVATAIAVCARAVNLQAEVDRKRLFREYFGNGMIVKMLDSWTIAWRRVR